jgi:hypothetical protein
MYMYENASLICCVNFPTAPGDYVPVVDVPLSFSIGAAVNSTSCANITINDDVIVEYDEEFTVSLTTTDPVIIEPIRESNVTIIDNDCKCPQPAVYICTFTFANSFLSSCHC